MLEFPLRCSFPGSIASLQIATFFLSRCKLRLVGLRGVASSNRTVGGLVQPLTRFVRRGGRLGTDPEPDERLTSSSSYGEHAECGQQLVSCAVVLLHCFIVLLVHFNGTQSICLLTHDFAAINV
jgi:hypothetical protein